MELVSDFEGELREVAIDGDIQIAAADDLAQLR